MKIVACALFAAIIAVCSLITIPLPSGVPVTLQTFAIALCAAVGGSVSGVVSTSVYILIGAVGVPVFSGMKGGFAVLLGPTGGFLFGFIPFAFLCGIGFKHIAARIGVSVAGLVVCHLIGAVQYALIAGISLWESICLVSLPFIIKDILSIATAHFAAVPIKKAISRFSEAK